MYKQMQNGFTLIELMVVIVIIGILAAIAIPSYLDNANRAKVTEGINIIAPIKISVSEIYIAQGEFPPGSSGNPAVAAAMGMGTPNMYATPIVQEAFYAQMNANQAVIVILYNAIGSAVAAGDSLVFTATGTANGVTWTCKSPNSTLADKYKPANCRGP